MIPLPILLLICVGQVVFAINLRGRTASRRERLAKAILAGVFVVEGMAIAGALVIEALYP